MKCKSRPVSDGITCPASKSHGRTAGSRYRSSRSKDKTLPTGIEYRYLGFCVRCSIPLKIYLFKRIAFLIRTMARPLRCSFLSLEEHVEFR